MGDFTPRLPKNRKNDSALMRFDYVAHGIERENKKCVDILLNS